MSIALLGAVDRWTRDRGKSGRRFLLPYDPFPRQEQFHACDAKYRLFGGAAGPGKSYALLMEGVDQALRNPGANTLLLRRTFPELEKSLLLYFRRNVPRELYRSFNEAKHQVTWLNGSMTQFGYSRSEHDIYQYQGSEFLFIGLDELTQFTLGQWTFLTSRNRCPLAATRPSMAGATNPGGIGHAWVKALWIEHRAAPGMENAAGYDPDDYAYIPALIKDNPVYRNNQDYLRTLEALPTHLRLAFLEGDWNLFAGQYFDIFSRRLHTARAEELQLVPWLPRWISMDWGFEHPAAVYWHAQDGARTYTYRELETRRVGPHALAREIAERSRGEKIDAVYLGPDAFARRTDDLSIADQIGDVLVQHGLPRPAPADNDRVGGWMLMYQLLEHQQWIIADNCRRLIEVLPALVRDERQVEDAAKVDGDDCADAARYGLKSRLRPRAAPLETRLVERMSQAQHRAAERGRVLDPTVQALLARKFEQDERKRQLPFFPRRWRRR